MKMSNAAKRSCIEKRFNLDYVPSRYVTAALNSVDAEADLSKLILEALPSM